MKSTNIRLAIFISGSGSTAEAVIKACLNKKICGIEPVVVVSSRADAAGNAKAHALGIPVITFTGHQFATSSDLDNLLNSILSRYKVDVISQNGWLPLTPGAIVRAYQGKIINQHPGPLDVGHCDFGGKGMYGKRVTCARIAYAWMVGHDYWTEATTHHVTEEFDKGNIIRTERLTFPKLSKRLTTTELQNKPNSLIDATNRVSANLLPLEHNNVVATLAAFGRDRKFPISQRDSRLIKTKDTQVLDQAKTLAIKLFPAG